jgi:hypothetical protein
MLLLADENFPKPVIEVLRAEGHDVLWARTDHAGARDLVLLDLAEAEARIVLTLDKDFWQIAPPVRAFIAADTAWQDISASSRPTEFQMVAAARQ